MPTIHLRNNTIVLYKRPESPKWQAELRYPEEGTVRKISTRIENEHEAAIFAFQLYEEQRASARLPKPKIPFGEFCKKYRYDLLTKPIQKPIYATYLRHLENYVEPFFGSTHMRQELTTTALTMAIQRQRPGPGLIHHSDRGSQYAAGGYRQVLDAANIVQSMSRKGNCWDNAPMESFFHTLKTELVHHAAYATREAAKRDLFAYIEGYYNRQRLHSALGYLTPEQAELQAA
jgi:hypothetical protein